MIPGMAAVQLMLDAPLLRDIDRHAKKASLSRSEFVRKSMREALARLAYLEAVEVERQAYRQTPPRSAERALVRAARTRASATVVADGDDW
jgi:metal-responsive CopG/Arc/MetJ family transcriptional regulator